MPIFARSARQLTHPLATDPAWLDVAREVQTASDLMLRYGSYGLSRASAGWVAEDHLRQALMYWEQMIDRHVAQARTRLGRAWRRRTTRPYVEQLQEALWFTQRMQGWGELIWPPALVFRNGALPLLDQAIQQLASRDEEALHASTASGDTGEVKRPVRGTRRRRAGAAVTREQYV